MSTFISELFVDGSTGWEDVAPGVSRKILGYDDALMMVAVQFTQGAVGAMHHHPHRQVTYVVAGEFEVLLNGEKRVLRAGDSFLAPPEAPHGVVALSNGKLVDVFTPARTDFVK